MAILTQQKRDVSVCGDFKTSGFKINASAKAFEILSSNIYTNKVAAVIREYSCNAYDAHVAAGNQDRQFDVNLPTSLDSTFSVRDYGTGLNEQQVREIFTTYFQSTKTNSNDFIGALGLGSKSAFSLVDSFTVTSFLNGEKSVYSCYKDEHGEPQVAMLGQSNTDEDNGLEISMAVSSDLIEDFASDAVGVFKYFETLPNINNSNVINCVKQAKDSYDFCFNGGKLKNNAYESLFARMGNVAYKIPSKYTQNLSGVLDFPIGSLSFNAGREELSMDEDTINLIEDRVKSVKDNLSEIVFEKLDSIECAFERAIQKREIKGTLRSFVCSNNQKRDKFESYDLPVLPLDGDDLVVFNRSSWGRGGTQQSKQKSCPTGETVTYVWEKPKMKSRILSWMKTKTGSLVVLSTKNADFFGVPHDMIQDPEVLFPKVQRKSRGGDIRSKVMVFNENSSYYAAPSSRWSDVEVINGGGVERVYVEVSRYIPVGHQMNMISRYNRTFGVKIYGLKTAFMKTKAFKDGNWKSLTEYLEEKKKTLDKVTIENYTTSSASYGIVKSVKDFVDDKRFSELFDMVQAGKKDKEAKEAEYRRLNFEDLIETSTRCSSFEEEIFQDYPMLSFISGWMSDQKIETVSQYINSISGNQNGE